ncbi:MAG: ArnT family glycosyltransferase [Chthoniobacterales bacterium]
MEARETQRRFWFSQIDPVLFVALLAAFAFSLHGIRWGRVEDWNPDQMALRRLSATLKPRGFLKPPFHTFVNHALVLWPMSLAESSAEAITKRKQNFDELKLLGSRLVVVAMFLGTVLIAYKIADEFYGRNAARIVALLFATSAGFFAYDHLLTADIPVVFWMILATMFAARIIREPRSNNYIFAGICTGLATATKYNGLAVGLALVVAHLLSKKWSWRALFPDRRLWLGLFMVPVGFVAGNPYAILDWRKFSSDFAYNYAVAPRYGGESGIGYDKFGQGIFNILGTPGGILVLLLAIVSILLLVRRKPDERASKCFLVCASVFVVYTLKIGAFPRVPTRFVLPAIPFLLLMIGPALQQHWLRGKWIYALFVPLLLYNCVCSFYVGKRFRDDPRTAAQSWMETNVRPGSRIESSAASPHWSKLPRLNAVETSARKPKLSKARAEQTIDLRMPHPNSRAELFAKVFEGDEDLIAAARQRESPPDLRQFTHEELESRNPDYIAVYSADHSAPIATVRQYYDDLLQEKFPYRIAFGRTSPKVPWWIYPQDIDHLSGRITILTRADKTTR